MRERERGEKRERERETERERENTIIQRESITEEEKGTV